MAPLKLASGCDRRCSFCAIPSFRGSFVSRRPSDVLQEAQWLATQGVKELFLVSENSTSYGKDLGDLRLLETLLPELAGDRRHRAGTRLLPPARRDPARPDRGHRRRRRASCPYFDLSFQHASATVLRRMRRFGDPESFLGLLEQIRTLAPQAGVRSNVIVGFPGETEDDLQTLCDFLDAARMDVTGVFGYSDEDGTEAASFVRRQAGRGRGPRPHRARHRSRRGAQRPAGRGAHRRGGRRARRAHRRGRPVGRAAHQGPEVDGTTLLTDVSDAGRRPA